MNNDFYEFLKDMRKFFQKNAEFYDDLIKKYKKMIKEMEDKRKR